MRAKGKRLFKRLLKLGGLIFLAGMIFVLGVLAGQDSASERHTVVVRGDSPVRFEAEPEIAIQERIEREVVERIEEQIVIPPIPTVPPMPPIPEIPPIPTTIHIDRGPGFFEVVNGIGTILASLALIALGVMMVVRGRRMPKEKSPESLNL